MASTVKALSEQISQFQALMLASQETITKNIAEVKQEMKQIGAEIKRVKAIAVKAKSMAQDYKEQIDQLKKMNAAVGQKQEHKPLYIWDIRRYRPKEFGTMCCGINISERNRAN